MNEGRLKEPKEYVSRNDTAEKFNEITGRQMQAEADPLVEIRSAVHSNYAGMVAMLGADNRLYLGKSENYQYNYENPSFYDNGDGSLCFVSDMPDMYYFLYGEGWHRSQDEMLEHGLSMEQYHEFARMQDGVLREHTLREGREIRFAGQPFQPPENYLQAAEMSAESNYNMLDGIINNEKPVRPDLTDGQTYDELVELAPETLPENNRPSVLEQLKSKGSKCEARQVKTFEAERSL